MTGNNPRHAILVPGADSLSFTEDSAEAAHRSIHVHELALPAFTGHPIDDRQRHFDQVADITVAKIEHIRKADPAASIAAIGRNNGGGQLAWAMTRKLDLNALILVGAIPEISRYRREGSAKSALSFRKSLPNPGDIDRIGDMAAMDIVSTSQYFPEGRTLIQFGRNDPYIDETAIQPAETLAKRFRVEWSDDDHAMVSKPVLTQRWDFIEETLNLG